MDKKPEEKDSNEKSEGKILVVINDGEKKAKSGQWIMKEAFEKVMWKQGAEEEITAILVKNRTWDLVSRSPNEVTQQVKNTISSWTIA